MPLPPQQGLVRRALSAVGSGLLRLVRVLFFLALIVIPVPISVFPRPGRRDRRNLPAQILKQDR